MSAADKGESTHATIVSDLHRVGGGYAVQFRTHALVDGVLPIACEWSPTIPSERERRRKVDMQRYDHALAQFLQAVADVFPGQAGGRHAE